MNPGTTFIAGGGRYEQCPWSVAPTAERTSTPVLWHQQALAARLTCSSVENIPVHLFGVLCGLLWGRVSSPCLSRSRVCSVTREALRHVWILSALTFPTGGVLATSIADWCPLWVISDMAIFSLKFVCCVRNYDTEPTTVMSVWC